VTQYVGTFTDLTDRKRIEEERARLARHDPLTGVANRPFLEEKLRLAIAHALQTESTGRAVSVDAPGILEALRKVYGADELVRELAVR
jgi:GGDEF domain-containing protein